MLEEFESNELCPECQVIMLPRSRHCNVCKKCVDRWDHHCPWLNTCIGGRNHAYFLFFVIFITGYLFLVTAVLIFFLVLYCKDKLVTKVIEVSITGEPIDSIILSSCTSEHSITDWCLLIDNVSLFTSDNNTAAMVILWTCCILSFILSAGFFFPVCILLKLQIGNFWMGLTTNERLSKVGT